MNAHRDQIISEAYTSGSDFYPALGDIPGRLLGVHIKGGTQDDTIAFTRGEDGSPYLELRANSGKDSYIKMPGAGIPWQTYVDVTWTAEQVQVTVFYTLDSPQSLG